MVAAGIGREIDAAVPGEYIASLGGAQPQEAASVQTGKFNVTGRAELPK
jgi:hypothetical protein